MAHSKMTKRGYSHYVESWNPKAKRFISTCALCGDVGFNPSILEEGFVTENGKTNYEHHAIRCELTRILKPLPTDELGRCEVCRRHSEK